jgi:hypothetical protein
VESGGLQWMTALGRLSPGVSPESARAELNELLGGYLRDVVERFHLQGVLDPRAFAATTEPVSDAILGRTRPLLLSLFGAVLLVLLIASTNVAGLLLMQIADRRTEMAVRIALGAGRATLIRTVFMESLLLSVLGGSAGLVGAWLAVPLLMRLSPEDVPRLREATVDARIFSFALVVLVATALLSSLGSVLLVLRTPLETTLREGAHRVAGGRTRLRSALVVSQVAAALVLLVCAGLLGRTLVELRHVPLGFEPERVLAVGVYASESRYPDRASWRRSIRKSFVACKRCRASTPPRRSVCALCPARPAGTIPLLLKANPKPKQAETPMPTWKRLAPITSEPWGSR